MTKSTFKKIIYILILCGAVNMQVFADQQVSIPEVVVARVQGYEHTQNNEALYNACLTQDWAAAEKLVDAGAVAVYRDYDNWTALHIACSAKAPEALVLKIIPGADVTIATTDKETALHIALYEGCSDAVVKALVKAGASISVADGDGKSAQDIAKEQGRDFDFENVWLTTCDVHATDADGNTPLHIALQKRYSASVVKDLIARGADVNVANTAGFTPLCIASREKALTPTIKVLLKSGAYLFHNYDYSQEHREKCPLHNVMPNHKKTFFSDIVCEAARTYPLSLSSQQVSDQVVEPIMFSLFCPRALAILLDRGVDVNRNIPFQGSSIPFFFVAASSIVLFELTFEGIDMLLKRGLDPKVTGPDGSTIWHCLSAMPPFFFRSKNVSCLWNRLSKFDIDINAKDYTGQTAGHILCSQGVSPKALKLVLDLGMDLYQTDASGITVIELIMTHSLYDEKTMKVLIEQVDLLANDVTRIIDEYRNNLDMLTVLYKKYPDAKASDGTTVLALISSLDPEGTENL